jgi:hypothetical protein
MTRHPFTDPRPGDIVGFAQEHLMSDEPELLRTVSSVDGDLVFFFEKRGIRERQRKVRIKSWTSWCRRHYVRVLSHQHHCIGSPVGERKPDCAADEPLGHPGMADQLSKKGY